MRLLRLSAAVVILALVAPVSGGCGRLSQLDLGELIVTVTPSPEASATPSPTMVLTTRPPTETPIGWLMATATQSAVDLSCDGARRVIRCVAEWCVVRDAQSGGSETIAYQVPYGTTLQALGLCECPTCVPFSRWYWLGVDSRGISYWVVALDDVWTESNER